MTGALIPPAYGTGSLGELLPSALAAIGTPGFDNVLELPPAPRVCVLLIDGLGASLLGRHARLAPFLSSLPARELTAGFPSTTATSLASLGTGRTPGEHGLLGYQVAIPGAGRLLNHLRWDADIDPVAWQPHRTVFELATDAGTPVYHVAPGAFRDSGLTRAGLRGTRYVAAETPGDLVAGAVAALTAEPRALVFAYHGDVDKTGHLRGCGSAAWRHQLRITDGIVAELAAAMPPDAILVVTSDHGMVDVPPDRQTDIDVVTELRAGVTMVSGEARARHVHVEPGAQADVLATWRECLTDGTVVVTGDEAIAAGWFGPVFAAVNRGRIGDVIAVATSDTAVVSSAVEPGEARLVGQHGSMTPAEMLVPLLITGR